MKRHPHLTIWRLVHLGHELDEISCKLAILAAQLNRGHADHKLFEMAFRQIRKCGHRLEHILHKRHPRGH